MTGKHSKYHGRFGLTSRAISALVGLAFVGAAATTAHASILSLDDKAGDSVAAVQAPSKKQTTDKKTTHQKKTTARAMADGSDAKDARSEVISRARTWHPHTDQRIPYSQTSTHDGYRTDCSGYVAMALGLSSPGPNTVGLTSSRYTERIAMSELKKGDLVMDAEGSNTTRHVVIFEKWADGEHTSYWAYEQRGRYGTDHRTRDYGVSSGSEYKAYRPTNI